METGMPIEVQERFKRQRESAANAMNVGQLITALMAFPLDLPVVVDGDFIESIAIVDEHNLGDPGYPHWGCETCKAVYIN